jgi:hypothetical protein
MVKACEERLACIWQVDPEESQLDQDRAKLVSNMKTPESFVFKEGEKLALFITLSCFTQKQSISSETVDESIAILRGYPQILDNLGVIFLSDRVPVSFSKLMQNWTGGQQYKNHSPVTSSGGARETLASCFSFFREPEILDERNMWFCPHCRKHVRAKKQLDIWKVPDVLIIHLKRFGGGRYAKKLDTYVDFPDQINMRQYVVGPQKNYDNLYRLYGVSNHMGGMGGGHYTANAIVQNPFNPPDPNPQWYNFNDSSARKCEASDVHSAAAYVLFYERIEAGAEPESDALLAQD